MGGDWVSFAVTIALGCKSPIDGEPVGIGVGNRLLDGGAQGTEATAVCNTKSCHFCYNEDVWRGYASVCRCRNAIGYLIICVYT